MPTKKSSDFESQLDELQKIVSKMEGGDLSLDESLKDFEKATSLLQSCHKTLKTAEQKVDILIKKGDQATLSDFEPEEE